MTQGHGHIKGVLAAWATMMLIELDYKDMRIIGDDAESGVLFTQRVPIVLCLLVKDLYV